MFPVLAFVFLLPTQTQDKTNLDVEQLLAWLPTDTETIIVTRGPFKIESGKRNDETPDLPKMLEGMALGPLASLGRGRFVNHLKGQAVTLALEGSRAFRPPRDLGLMPYQGCDIVVFQQDIGSAGDALMKALQEGGGNTIKLLGHEVAVREEKWEIDTWTIFITRPKPNILLCATDKGYLEEVLKRMDKPGEGRALAAALPEWKHANTKARFWALRHYEKKYAATDPTSPLTTDKRAANQPDPQAIGTVFTFDPAKDAQPKMTYLSKNPQALAIATKGWTYPHEGLSPKIHEIMPGVVEIRVDLKERRTIQMFVLVLITSFGHGVYL
jgi:hypothetical protein